MSSGAAQYSSYVIWRTNRAASVRDNNTEDRYLAFLIALDKRDIFYSSNSWPMSYRNLYLSQSKNNYADRFKLFAFFVLNGMQPKDAVNEVLVRHLYDISAVNHVLALERDFINQTGTAPKWTSFMMDKGRYITAEQWDREYPSLGTKRWRGQRE